MLIRTEVMIFFHFWLVQFCASRLCFPKILFFQVWRFAKGSIFQSSQFWLNVGIWQGTEDYLQIVDWVAMEWIQPLKFDILSRVFRDSKSRVLVGPSVGRSVITLGYFFVYIYSVLSLTVVVLKCPKGQYVLRRRAGGQDFVPPWKEQEWNRARIKWRKNEMEKE